MKKPPLRRFFLPGSRAAQAFPAPRALDAVAVREGALDATLDLEPALPQRDTLWLEVREESGSYVPLAQREALRPKAAAGACREIFGTASPSAATNFLGTAGGAALRVQSTATWESAPRRRRASCM